MPEPSDTDQSRVCPVCKKEMQPILRFKGSVVVLCSECRISVAVPESTIPAPPIKDA